MKTETNFQQRAKVGVAGNFINQMMANNSTLPEVGKGATELLYSDRHVYEVIEVSKDKKTVKLEILDAVHDPSKPGGMGHQNWIFNPTGQYITVVWRWGSWKRKRKIVKFTKEAEAKAAAEGKFAIATSLTPEQREAIYNGDCHPNGIVEGITEYGYEYSKIKLLFGVKDYRYDWEF